MCLLRELQGEIDEQIDLKACLALPAALHPQLWRPVAHGHDSGTDLCLKMFLASLTSICSNSMLDSIGILSPQHLCCCMHEITAACAMYLGLGAPGGLRAHGGKEGSWGKGLTRRGGGTIAMWQFCHIAASRIAQIQFHASMLHALLKMLGKYARS